DHSQQAVVGTAWRERSLAWPSLMSWKPRPAIMAALSTVKALEGRRRSRLFLADQAASSRRRRELAGTPPPVRVVRGGGSGVARASRLGPPGYGRPRIVAALSKASPMASSMVAPRRVSLDQECTR